MSKREKFLLFLLLDCIYALLVMSADTSLAAMLMALILFAICGSLFVRED